MIYSRVGSKEDLVVRSMSDASYLKVKESVGGSLVMLSNKNNNKTVPLYWKSKRITKISPSTKDAETHALFKNVADAAFVASNVETLLFGDVKQRIKVESYIDSKPLLESIASTRIVENKFLVSEINALKMLLENGVVDNFTWVGTEDQLADVLTKDMVEPYMFRKVFLKNSGVFMNLKGNPKAVVKVHDKGTDDESKEIRLVNIRS